MKVFLAGNDRGDYAYSLRDIEYPYRLTSYYYMKKEPKVVPGVLECAQDGSEWIMDSGLFSLMFGSEQGTLKTYEDFYRYASEYVENCRKWNWKHAIVECDVQRVLGVEETFKLRESVFDKSGFEVIHVWHLPEKEDGLAKLAATRKRIALSVPELRVVMGTGPTGGTKVATAVLHLLKVARAAGPAQIHLLGCTEDRLMRMPADSCDSTSWNSINRYGVGYVYGGKGQLLQAHAHSPKWYAWRKHCEQSWPKAFASIRGKWTEPRTQSFFVNAAVSAQAFRLYMESINE